MLLSTTVAAVWSLAVPLLQAPDENVHVDYVLAVQRAGHLLTARDGRQEPDPSIAVSPLLALLEQATDFAAVRQHPDRRMPAGYGSRDFRAAIDDQAAALPPPAELPFLVSYYPVAYYALGALVMAAALQVVGAFEAVIAVRLLSVALLGATLVADYLLLRTLRVRRSWALLQVALLGLLPMTSFVASYVQPDNLALFAVTLTLYLGAKLARGPAGNGLLAALAAALALLALTKYQDFGIVFGALALAFSVTGRWSARTALAVTAGPLAAFALQAWISIGPSPTYFSPTPDPTGRRPSVTALHAALAHGPLEMVAFLLQQTGRALVDYFCFGPVAISFWGSFGWLDTELVIGNPALSLVIRLLLAVGTLAVVGLSLARLWRLLVGSGRRGRLIVLANPVLTSYVAFMLFMVGAFVYTGGSLYPQGRYWLPFLPGLLYMTVVFAPRALRRAQPRALTTRVVAAGLLAYVILGAPFALLSVERRYFGPGPQAGTTVACSQAVTAPSSICAPR